MEITAKRTGNVRDNTHGIEVYFEYQLHLHFFLKDYVGMQSWIMNDDKFKFKIELTFKGDTTILTEYDSIEKWRTVIELVRTLLTAKK